MKTFMQSLTFTSAMLVSLGSFAQAQAPVTKPAASTPASVPTPVAKPSVATPGPASDKSSVPEKSATGNKKSSVPTSSAAPAAGGGDGKVWVNPASKTYHCAGSKYYGKTKKGEYMTEADAKAKGNHADHKKACS